MGDRTPLDAWIDRMVRAHQMIVSNVLGVTAIYTPSAVVHFGGPFYFAADVEATPSHSPPPAPPRNRHERRADKTRRRRTQHRP